MFGGAACRHLQLTSDRITPVPTEWSMIIRRSDILYLVSICLTKIDQYVDCDLLVLVSNERIDEGNAKVRK